MKLIYDEAGRGDCVVLIHGHPFDRTLWEPQVAALRDGFRVLVPDLRGFGESPVTPGSVTMREFAADIEGLLDDLRITRAAIVGLSMGGLVTMELAVSQPERYWAMGLVATTVEPVTPRRAARLERAGAVERDGMPVLDLAGSLGQFVETADVIGRPTPARPPSGPGGRAPRSPWGHGWSADRRPIFRPRVVEPFVRSGQRFVAHHDLRGRGLLHGFLACFDGKATGWKALGTRT